MRRHLLTTATLALLLTAVPASAALAGERAGDPMEEPGDGSGDDPDGEVRDRQPAGDEEPSGNPGRSDGESDPSGDETGRTPATTPRQTGRPSAASRR